LSFIRVGGPDQCSLRWNAKNNVVVIVAGGLWTELSARNNGACASGSTRGQAQW